MEQAGQHIVRLHDNGDSERQHQQRPGGCEVGKDKKYGDTERALTQ